MQPGNPLTFPQIHTAGSVLGFAWVEMYVGNAHQAAHYFQTRFGFELVQIANVDVCKSPVTRVFLRANEVCLVVTSPLRSGPVADYIHRHGDSVRDVAFVVDDVEAAFDWAVRNGARPVEAPSRTAGGWRAVVGTPGDLVHSLVTSDGLPALTAFPLGAKRPIGHKPLFQALDHVALAVDSGQLSEWVTFYEAAFSLVNTHSESISTEWTAMESKVMENRTRTVKFPIVEPAQGRKESQVSEFLSYHDGAGVQHLAVLCDDIASAVRSLRSSGVEFLDIPDAYYEMLPKRLGDAHESFEALREARVMIDRDEWGDLIQTFSRPITGRPTLFFELVQRNGSRGFGRGNIRALFEAVEREQAARVGW